MAMSPNKEDYLKLIFELGGAEQMVSNKQIVAGLHVSAASVSEMISKLVKDGYVQHSPYQGVKLCEPGLKKASTLLRKHRLWEVFLVEYLNYAWNDVHEEAEVLEHVTSSELANRLDQFLNHPEKCPHGGVIPKDNTIAHEKKLNTLADYPIGTKVKIERVLDEKELLDYLETLPLSIDDELTVTNIGAYAGAITLKNNQKSVDISLKAAGNVFVSTL